MASKGGYVARLLGERSQMTTRVKGRKLHVESDCGLDDAKVALIGDFINYCCSQLELQGGFIIHLVADRKPHRIETTAFCDPDSGVMKIYSKGRAAPDIMRSIAHELAHLRQGEKGEIGPNPIQYAGGYLEDDANAKAGVLLKLFARSYGMNRVYDA